MTFKMYVTAYESISTDYFINVFVYVYPPVVAKQRLHKNFTAAMNYTCNNRRIIECVVCYEVCVVLKEVSD
jgi:hypothetical protein